MWIVFNGEIYNYRRSGRSSKLGGTVSQLIAIPRPSFTSTKTGAMPVFPLLNGMFAFAIWDERRERLLVGTG